jgi:predicted dehydrogenase/threonine dehydrogenase-like Zn-dependent dehydrogenase
MKQILQSIRNGVTKIAEVPYPNLSPNNALIKSTVSLVSVGTERMLVEFGRASLLNKAQQQPDKVKEVLQKIRTDGIAPTIESVLNKLNEPIQLGYCNVGRIIKLPNSDRSIFKVGDRVVSNGKHAEIVSSPFNLCAKIPDGVSDEEAAFTVVGAIALQGIRLANLTLGERVVVYGLGVIGLLAVQILRAQGCKVLAIDFDEYKLKKAKKFGAEIVNLGVVNNPLQMASQFSGGRGVDAVIITAATKSDEVIHYSAIMSRKRGRIILVGVVGLNISRADFYEKELTFQVSCSYGPGRYDFQYEENGVDYPFPFVRWTEQRNFEAILDLMSQGRLSVSELISHEVTIDHAPEIYNKLINDSAALGILIRYSGEVSIESPAKTINLNYKKSNLDKGTKPAINFIGAGGYATKFLIPAFINAKARLNIISSNAGVSSVYAGCRFGFLKATTDLDLVFSEPNDQAVVIATRHDTHASLVKRCLLSGKSVFVEKPLCLTLIELDDIQKIYSGLDKNSNGPILMVGFNRRFSPHIQMIKKMLQGRNTPKAFCMTINAGEVQSDHWTQDRKVGGGRIIGETCHFIDLLRYLAGSPIDDYSIIEMDSQMRDTCVINLIFKDGSVGVINYFSNGSKNFPKERLEVFSSGAILQLDNFKKLKGYGWPGFTKYNCWKQNKGQNECVSSFVDAIMTNTPSPIPPDEIFEVSRVVIDLGS